MCSRTCSNKRFSTAKKTVLWQLLRVLFKIFNDHPCPFCVGVPPWATYGTKYFWELVELLGSYIVAQCVEKMRLCVFNRLGGNFGFYFKYMIVQHRVHIIRAV